MASWLQALAIETTTDIFLRKQKSGHFSGLVLYKNNPQKHLVVEGTYNITSNILTLKATQLKKLPPRKYAKSKIQIYPLLQVQASEQLGSILPSKISKGTHIYFKELGTQKVSNILGMGDLNNSHPKPKTSHFTSSTHPVTRFSTDPTKITRNQQSPQTQSTLTESNARFFKPSTLSTLSTKTSTPTSRRTRTSSASKTSKPSTRARSTRTSTTSRTTSTTKRTSKTSSSSTRTSSNQSHNNTSPALQDLQPSTSNSANSQDLTISNPSDNQSSYVSPDDNLLPMPIVQNQAPTQTTNTKQSAQLETQNTPIDLDSINDGTQEVACGYWTYEDDKLQAIRPTLMRRLDRASGQYLDISPCNFDSTYGKSGKIILAYTQLPDQIQEFAPVKTTHTFTLSKANYSEKLCYRARTRQCLYIEPNSVQEWTSTYLTITIRTTKTYKRPPQVGSDISTEYKQILDENKAERSTIINKNDLHLSPQFMEFVEVYEGKYLDSNTANAPEYLAWKEKVVRPNQGTCSQYAIEELSRNKKVLPSIHNTKIVCVKSGDYLLDQNKP